MPTLIKVALTYNVCKKLTLFYIVQKSYIILYFQDKWIALLHHVCNEHDWLGGACDHEDGEHDASLPWFDKRFQGEVLLGKLNYTRPVFAYFT